MTKKVEPLGCATLPTPVSTSSPDASTQITQKPDDDSRQRDDDNSQRDENNHQIVDDNSQSDDDNSQSVDNNQNSDNDNPQFDDNRPQLDDDHSQTVYSSNQPNKKLRRDPAFDHCNSPSLETSGACSSSDTLECNPTMKLCHNENSKLSESSYKTTAIKCEVDTDVNEDLYEVKDEFSSPTHNNRLDRESELVEIPGKLDCNEATDKSLCMEKEFDVTSVKKEPILDLGEYINLITHKAFRHILHTYCLQYLTTILVIDVESIDSILFVYWDYMYV